MNSVPTDVLGQLKSEHVVRWDGGDKIPIVNGIPKTVAECKGNHSRIIAFFKKDAGSLLYNDTYSTVKS